MQFISFCFIHFCKLSHICHVLIHNMTRHIDFYYRAEEMSLDLHEHEPKEAIRFLRLHLSSLSGIPCRSFFFLVHIFFSSLKYTMTWFYISSSAIRYLKVTVSGNTEDTKEGARKRLVCWVINYVIAEIVLFLFFPHLQWLCSFLMNCQLLIVRKIYLVSCGSLFLS